MSFDPEKVRRVDYDEIDGEYECTNGAYVSFSDYDQLLALYREAVADLERYGHGDSWDLKYPKQQ